MKKSIFPLLLFLITAITVNSQDIEKKPPEVNLSVGITLPKSDFGRTENFAYEGFAQNGLIAEAGYTQFLGKTFGVNMQLMYATFPMNEAALSDLFNNSFNQSSGVQTEAGSYAAGCLMANAVFDFAVSRFNFRFKVGFGGAVASHPQVKITDVDYGELRTIPSDVNVASMVGINGEIHFSLTEKHRIALVYDSQVYSPVFEDKSNGKNFATDFLYRSLSIGYVYLLRSKK